ncbi:bifunctional adenosylcobinamide kinase/adenosylcobinamide-phosphate guanylyltransferase [Bacillus sp. FJAT-27251]|uniref:bifunctional adenosylcobinamide kinase/adenosylcobinamide-phosphate guanylyltransferase n=1 Tax=Bacillus sp. FJAT-27251 TaxID=1684142 RepID=UPI0006A7B99F|nr:bifunctional adenosylcobinamide kinase/adenosylcobinamide-phosphate guanylyltransferase [Bacillus sp. FJAT-27251]
MEEQGIIFISGGVRSGKSSFAEELAAKLACDSNAQLHYIASGQASDPEMSERISRHIKDRERSGLNWTTWEQPRDLARLAPCFSKNDVVLLDCLTTLLNNEFFRGTWQEHSFPEDVVSSIIEAVRQIADSCNSLILVSNEVAHEPLVGNELVFCYVSALGSLHQKIVSIASEAFLVESGVPLMMKGAMKR